MSRVNDLMIQQLRKEQLTTRAHLAVRPVLTPMKSVFPQLWRVQVIGGQVVNGLSVIQYSADPLTATSAYNPTTATVYQIGMGYGWLYNAAGQQLQKVNIRHRYAAFTDPIIAGCVYGVPSTPYSIPVTGGGTIRAYDLVYG